MNSTYSKSDEAFFPTAHQKLRSEVRQTIKYTKAKNKQKRATTKYNWAD